MKIFLSVLLLCVSLLSLFLELDKSALELYYQSFDRAVYSFALAKGLNALISVIQSSEINIGVVVSGTVGLGEILDPLNDLVERFSWIMLASSVSIGIQHLLLMLGKTLFLKVALVAASLMTIMLMWIKKLHSSVAFLILLKVIFLLVILRFGAVTFVYLNDSFYNNIYAENYESSTKYISNYKDELDVEDVPKTKNELSRYLDLFEQKIEVFSKKVIKLITIFVVTTVIFPLLYIWFLMILLRWVFNFKFDKDKIILMLNKKGIK